MIYHAYCGYYSIYGNEKHTTYVCPGISLQINNNCSKEEKEIFSKHFEKAVEELRSTTKFLERIESITNKTK